MIRTAFSLLIAATLVMACASPGPRIMGQANPQANITGAKTFGFMSPAGTDRDNGVRTPLTGMLETSLRQEMTSRGFTESNNPDLLLNFFVLTEERLDVRQTPTMGRSHRYSRGRYRTWSGYETTVRQYTQGTLAIDVVDRANNVLAWEGAAQSRLRGNATLTQEQANEVVGLIMVEFDTAR